ncbi:MAG: hypothetical protein HOY71_33600, partial [Nonomuraea sp.]|nr:hypothetical protein [Nonomuraea sp.]
QPPSEPPAPGDVRVAGSPTQVNAPIPAWESGESTGFLGSGWSGSDSGYEELGEPEPRGRRGRRKRGPHDELDRAAAGGRGKVALLSVAAVAVVLGGTVAGVKMMSSSTTADQCPGAKCVAVQATNQPGPAVSSTAPAEDEEPTEEPTTDDPTTPAAVATTRAPVPRRTHAPTPTASPTKKARVKQSATPTREPTEDLQPTEEPTDDGLPTSSDQPSVVTTGEGTPIPSAQPTTSSIMGGSVNVGFDVSRRGLAGYSAKVHVANTSPQALSAATVSVPVTGKVLDVRGADWSQDGDLLIIDMPASLPSGESVDISFDAAGRASTPETCGLVGGDCTVN